jgi:hypothetical protein
MLIAIVSDTFKEVKRFEEQEMLRHPATQILEVARARQLGLWEGSDLLVSAIKAMGLGRVLLMPAAQLQAALRRLDLQHRDEESQKRKWMRRALAKLQSWVNDSPRPYFHVLVPLGTAGSSSRRPGKQHRQQRKMERDKERDGWLQGSHQMVQQVARQVEGLQSQAGNRHSSLSEELRRVVASEMEQRDSSLRGELTGLRQELRQMQASIDMLVQRLGQQQQ